MWMQISTQLIGRIKKRKKLQNERDKNGQADKRWDEKVQKSTNKMIKIRPINGFYWIVSFTIQNANLLLATYLKAMSKIDYCA